MAAAPDIAHNESRADQTRPVVAVPHEKYSVGGLNAVVSNAPLKGLLVSVLELRDDPPYGVRCALRIPSQ
jgi:hypothetical protein